MLYGNLTKTLRLNRTVAFGILFYHSLTYVWAKPTAVLEWTILGSAAGLTLLFLLANELGRFTLKKFAETESLPLGKVCILMPVSVMAFITAEYVLTGNGWLMMLGLAPILEAQLFGFLFLSQMLLYTWLGISGTLTLMGYPHVTPLSPLMATLYALPVLFTAFHFGTFITALVKSASTQVNWLQSLATTDGLTGLINRRQFNHRLQAEIARARRHHNPLSLALFDIDDFKKINDLYGHQVGDRILKELGALIIENVRESDIPARYGGEEFALILPETRQVEAYDLLERLRSLVERTVFCLPDNPLTMSISVGVAQLNMDNHTAFELVEEADAALYEAKKQGKNRVIYGIVPTPKISYKQTFNIR